MNYQEKLLKAIRQKTGGASVIDAIASVLGISYDASHRRVSKKSKFSIEETVVLCRHYAISMDSLFADEQSVVVNKTAEIRTLEDMAEYFRQSAEKLRIYTNYPDAKMYYSAKDIPLFHTIGGTLLSKFKLYVWLNLLAGNQDQDRFENFAVNQLLLEHSSKLKTVYDTIEINEIWNDTTINSSLQQIYYFFQSGLLSLQNAQHLCQDLHAILHAAENRCCNSKSRYHLYYNELLILNNNVLFTNPKEQSLFVPYTMLGYFITSDAATCMDALKFFQHQVKNSKSLNDSGPRDRKLFFNKAHQKIDFYEERIKNEASFEF